MINISLKLHRFGLRVATREHQSHIKGHGIAAQINNNNKELENNALTIYRSTHSGIVTIFHRQFFILPLT